MTFPNPRPRFDAALRGEFTALEEALHHLGTRGDVSSRAWTVAFRALRWFAVPAPSPSQFPTLEELAVFEGAPPADRAVVGLALSLRVRRAVLLFDGADIARVNEVFQKIIAGLTVGEATDWFSVARSWGRIAQGLPALPDLREVEARARRAGHADRTIEAAVVRAFSAELDGNMEEALTLSRRASRMARSESLPQLEFLAHLSLARARRILGKPHLTSRIVAGLVKVVTPPWHAWLGWESVLAQGTAKGVLEGTLTEGLIETLAACRSGDAYRFAETRRRVWRRAQGFAPCANDFRHLLAAIDPFADLETAPRSVGEFCRGEVNEVPRGLQGISGSASGGAQVFVWSIPGVSPRRVLGPGATLTLAAHPDGAKIDADGKQLRTDSTIAVLLLAGPEGMDELALFRVIYGFDYEPARHQSVRGVLYGRIKKRLGDAGEFVRENGCVRIEHRGILVADPRCDPPPEHRILLALARLKRAGAKDVAVELGIPLRTAQEALRRLSSDGALRSERAARGLHYILEDTTFSEPTRQTHG
ncbi:MAG: hypothetical protein AAGF12_03220 [Myxococcota bacterium]